MAFSRHSSYALLPGDYSVLCSSGHAAVEVFFAGGLSPAGWEGGPVQALAPG